MSTVPLSRLTVSIAAIAPTPRGASAHPTASTG